MNTKNKEIERIWEEVKEDNSITIDKYQLAVIFDRGYEYHKNTIVNDDLKSLTLSDLNMLEKELSKLVEDCTLSKTDKLDDNGKLYDKKLNEVSCEIERRIDTICKIKKH